MAEVLLEQDELLIECERWSFKKRRKDTDLQRECQGTLKAEIGAMCPQAK